LGSCVLFAQADRWSYPGTDRIDDDPEAYDGTKLLLFGRVTAVDRADRSVTIVASPLRVEARDVDSDVLEDLEPGASLQVYGTLGAGSSVIDTERTVVDYGGPGDKRYTRLTSILGALCALVAFLRYWRIDWRSLRFEPRRDV